MLQFPAELCPLSGEEPQPRRELGGDPGQAQEGEGGRVQEIPATGSRFHENIKHFVKFLINSTENVADFKSIFWVFNFD